ncbi:MAG: hypothetical protein P1U87_14940 [Verrucomicrobiales bacterium]|nr:hypothetical protein [Verrucomicrobiales bacterium]
MAAHLLHLKACPFLPPAERPLRAAEMKSVGEDRGAEFYLFALTCAQSLWLQGLPAQSILLMNRAFSSDLSGEESVLKEFPLPYGAMHWVMSHRLEDQFVGNPRRHFQHLATRMVEPRKTIRSWRAWGCWAYASTIFPDYPADEIQLEEEGVTEPGREDIFRALDEFGLAKENQLWASFLTPPFPES